MITKFCRVIETPSTHYVWSKYAPNKSKMADGRHLEKSNNLNIFAIDLTDFHEILNADASRLSEHH